jgi:hypothetical membrane protein
MTRLGPLVRTDAHGGGALFMLGSVQFILAMILVQLKYPGYSVTGNYISDLGSSTLSPWYAVFNGSVILLGILGIVGTLLVRSAFLARPSVRVGLFFLALASLGAILVGLFPETATELGGNIHSYVSDFAFVSSGFALLFLGFGMLRDPRWGIYGLYSILSGVLTFLAIAGFTAVASTGSYGSWERLVVAPILLWAIVAGAHIARLPAYSSIAVAARPAV